MRLALAAPFIGLSIALHVGAPAYFTGETANAALLARVRAIVIDAGSVDVISALYPPISSVLALLIPGGTLGLAIVGALCAGFLLQRVLEWFVRRDLGALEATALVVTIAGTPLFAMLVTTNLEITLGLLFFGLGMIDVVRFIMFANTQAGFRVGLLFAAAALSSPLFLLTVVIAAAVVPMLAHSRRGARLANGLVIVFPTVGAFVAVTLLGLVFRGDATFAFAAGGLGFDADRVERVAAVLGGTWGWLYFMPSLAGIILALIAGRWVLALAPPLLTASIVLMTLIGSTPTGSSGVSFLILALVLAAVTTGRFDGWRRVVFVVVTVSQIAVGWAMALLLYPSTGAWLTALVEGLR